MYSWGDTDDTEVFWDHNSSFFLTFVLFCMNVEFEGMTSQQIFLTASLGSRSYFCFFCYCCYSICTQSYLMKIFLFLFLRKPVIVGREKRYLVHKKNMINNFFIQNSFVLVENNVKLGIFFRRKKFHHLK